MSQLGVAVIGLGIGRRHIQAYQNIPGVKVIAIADIDEEALRKSQQELGIPFALTDHRHAICRDDVDIVSVCTPDRLHVGQSLSALEAGKHVLCEKPMATSLEDAAQVVDKVRETGLKFMAGHNYRFIPQFAQVKDIVASGELGDLFFADSSYIQDLYFMEDMGPDYWRIKDPQDFFLGGTVHNVDLLRWIVGEVEEVHSYSNHMMPFYPVDDNYVSSFRFANGCIGRVLLVLGARLKAKFCVDLNIYGYQGALKAVMQRSEVIKNMDKLEGDEPATIPVESVNSHEREIAHFVECVREDKQPSVDAVEGAKAVAVCVAAIRSARKGKPVMVDYSFLQG